MGEIIASVAAELIKQAPVMFICFIAGLAQYSWYKHTIKEIKDISKSSIEDIRKSYDDAYKKVVELYGSVIKRKE